jgi:hypothetical protein
LESYSEAAIKVRLSRLDRFARTAFAAACAERLWPLFERFHSATGEGDANALGSALDTAWSAALGEPVGDVSELQNTVEAMVPTDSHEWVHEMGYGQNAIAAVAYSLRAWASDDPQEAVWGARQVYEAADYAAQRAIGGDLDLNTPLAERALLETDIVQRALIGINADLDYAELVGPADWQSWRRQARADGARWGHDIP